MDEVNLVRGLLQTALHVYGGRIYQFSARCCKILLAQAGVRESGL
jgi:hypothetical protein